MHITKTVSPASLTCAHCHSVAYIYLNPSLLQLSLGMGRTREKKRKQKVTLSLTDASTTWELTTGKGSEQGQ